MKKIDIKTLAPQFDMKPRRLRYLIDLGLVDVEQEGKWAYYDLSDPELMAAQIRTIRYLNKEVGLSLSKIKAVHDSVVQKKEDTI